MKAPQFIASSLRKLILFFILRGISPSMFPNKNVEFNSSCLSNCPDMAGPTAVSVGPSSLVVEFVPAFDATGVAGLKNHDCLLALHGVLESVDAQVQEYSCGAHSCLSGIPVWHSHLSYSYHEYSCLEYFCSSLHAI
jgi:hypothetical protein